MVQKDSIALGMQYNASCLLRSWRSKYTLNPHKNVANVTPDGPSYLLNVFREAEIVPQMSAINVAKNVEDWKAETIDLPIRFTIVALFIDFILIKNVITFTGP
jgi:hypothetical protein